MRLTQSRRQHVENADARDPTPTGPYVLALAGGIAALGMAELGIRFLVSNGPANLPRLRDAGLHIEVLLADRPELAAALPHAGHGLSAASA